MVAAQPRPELLVIAGPTASGKSALALKIAKEFNGEIIAADSRTIYRGMDIGTAKPTAAEQKQIPHWGLDLVEPGQPYSAAKFKAYAKEVIRDIQSRDKLPIVVGGTGLYIDGLIYDFEFGGGMRPQERDKLEKLTTDQLRAKIKHMGFKMPLNDNNRRHLVRTIERRGQTGGRAALPQGVMLIGLRPPDAILKENISRRAQRIFKNGIITETRVLVGKYGQDNLENTAGIVYRPALAVISGGMSQTEAINRFQAADWQYARRQRTWFKRNSDIQWFGSADGAYRYLARLLNT